MSVSAQEAAPLVVPSAIAWLSTALGCPREIVRQLWFFASSSCWRGYREAANSGDLNGRDACDSWHPKNAAKCGFSLPFFLL